MGEIKDYMAKHKAILLALLVLLIYLSPNIFFPEQARFLMHDNLDSNVLWYKNMAESGKMFAANDAIVPNSLAGIPRGCYPSELNLLSLLYLWFPALLAYNLNTILLHLTAFFSMYVFSRRYIFKQQFDVMNAGVALCFSLLPFWPTASLSIAAQPLLLYAFLNILNKDLAWKNWLIVFFIPFCSILVFSNLFFGIILFAGFMAYSFYKKEVNFYFILAFGLFVAVSILSDYRLFKMQFINHFESHRVVTDSMGTLNFKGLIGVSIHHFLFGQYHVLSLQFPVILLLSVLALFICRNRTGKIGILLLLAAAYFISVIYIIPDWAPVSAALVRIPILKIFQMRFYTLFPLLWFAIFACSVYLLAKNGQLFKRISAFAIGVSIVFEFFSINDKDYQNTDCAENSFYNTYINPKTEGFATFNEYYKIDVFEELKKQLQPGDYYVGCIGLVPEAAQYNGFNTIDGYFFYYPKKYNQLMNEITLTERTKSNQAQLGSRCYLISAEVLKGNKEVTNLELDFKKIRGLGTRYIFSDRRIINENLLNERIVRSKARRDSVIVYDMANYTPN